MLEPRINMERLNATVNAIGCLQEAGNYDKAKEVYIGLAESIFESVGMVLEKVGE